MPEPVRSVVRSFDLLRQLAAADGPVSLASLSAETGLPKSTARRLLATLESVRAVEPGLEPGTYVSGPGLSAIVGRPSQPAIHSLAGPFLQDVVDLVGEDATLSILDRDTVVFTAQVAGPHPIQVPDGTGTRYPPHTVSSGFVLLSGWPEARLERYVADAAARDDLDADELSAKIADVRNRGFVWHVDGWVEGISAVAVPVRSDGEIVAALGAFGPTYRFPGERDPEALALEVARIGAELSSHLARP